MQVLLLNPPFPSGFRKVGISLPPLGLAYIASVLRKAGHRVRIVDLDVERKLNLSEVQEFDLVGITSDTSRFNLALAIAMELKKLGKKVVMGGPHVSFMDEEALRSGAVDVIVRGEGEITMLDLIEHFQGGGGLEDVPGISFMRDGILLRNSNRPFIRDLDSIPFPARDLLPLKRYPTRLEERKLTSVITSRGCPFNCSFCASSKLAGIRWRARSPESIVDEVEEIKRRFGIGAVGFVDDNFTLNPKRAIEVCEEILRRNLDVKWWCLSRVDTIVKHEEMVKSMARAGARLVFIGIESASQLILDSYGKKITLEMARKAIEILKKYKIRVWASFIIGYLDETKEMIQNTIKLAKKLGPHFAQFSILTPYPGTELFENVKDKLLHLKWELYDCLHPVLKTTYVTPKELRKYLLKAYASFYLRPSMLVRSKIRSIRSLSFISSLVYPSFKLTFRR
ncbi:radical SAM protein [Candidatus Poribacteria bacterium]|nr:radical SAM protein [Candidatus Poribacteria bacterium]